MRIHRIQILSTGWTANLANVPTLLARTRNWSIVLSARSFSGDQQSSYNNLTKFHLLTIMSESQRYPINTNLRNYVKDIVVFLEKLLILTIFSLVSIPEICLINVFLKENQWHLFHCLKGTVVWSLIHCFKI